MASFAEVELVVADASAPTGWAITPRRMARRTTTSTAMGSTGGNGARRIRLLHGVHVRLRLGARRPVVNTDRSGL